MHNVLYVSILYYFNCLSVCVCVCVSVMDMIHFRVSTPTFNEY